MALLKNNCGEASKIGYVCKADPKDPKAFVYAVAGDTNILGIISQSVPRYAQCEIVTSGVTKVFVFEMTSQGSIIRAQKSGDNISRGTCKTAKLGDAPYFKIGTALESKKGLVNCDLNLSYVSGLTDSLGLGAVADGTYTMGLGVSTDGVIIVKNGIIISLTEAT